MISRRDVLKFGFAAAGSLLAPADILYGQIKSEPALFPIQLLTHGPKFHWFGYYDKLQFDPAQRYVIGMEVGFEHRSPTENDVIKIGLIDLKKKNKWKTIGESRAWGWQQGCMAQWIPGSPDEVIWNDREKDRFTSRIYNVRTGKTRTLPKAIYTLSPDGKWGLGTEFSRIQGLRPGYGYPGIEDPYLKEKAPEGTGIYKINLATGEDKLLFSLAEIAAIPHRGEFVKNNYHWFNHLLINTDGSRFTFLHRWRHERTNRQTMAVGGFITRMFTANMDGSNLYCIDPSGNTSHFIWQSPVHLCVYTKPEGQEWGFYILEDQTANIQRLGQEKMKSNGHQSFLPVGNGKEWLVCDNYASGKNRNQVPYLYHIPSDRRIDLGSFYSPPEYSGEWRCDLHPRVSPDGTKICIDSPHGGNGRQLYLIDIKPFENTTHPGLD